MKLGIAYNFFDGGEWLEESLSRVYPLADNITIVAQTQSNWGQPISMRDSGILHRLEKLSKVEVTGYNPDLTQIPGWNECEKRRLGMDIARKKGSTHFMAMDADELYKTEQLKWALDEMGDHTASACQMQTYWGDRFHRLDPPETYWVPLIYKIGPENFELNAQTVPVLVDPTRRIPLQKWRLFERCEIEMHHMSYVRDNIESKLTNSSARINFADKVSEFLQYWRQWSPGQPAIMMGKELQKWDLKEI